MSTVIHAITRRKTVESYPTTILHTYTIPTAPPAASAAAAESSHHYGRRRPYVMTRDYSAVQTGSIIIQSIEFTLTRTSMKLFRTGSPSTVNECQVNFGFLPAKSQIGEGGPK